MKKKDTNLPLLALDIEMGHQSLWPAFRRYKKQVKGFCLDHPGKRKSCGSFHFAPLKLALEGFL